MKLATNVLILNLAVFLSLPIQSHAAAVITNGNTSLGVNDYGHLNVYSDGPGGPMTYGVFRNGVGDAISPGCLCEGWGVSANLNGSTNASWASIDNGGIGNISGGSFGSSLNRATSLVDSSVMPMSIKHDFGASLAQDIFQVTVTITNTSMSQTLTDLTYRRSMDWDVPPTVFSEYVSHHGVSNNLVANGGNVLYASDNGFAHASPLVGAGSIDLNTVNKDFDFSGPYDHGSVFDFYFGSLAPGQSQVFNIFYGSAATRAEAISNLQVLNADTYSLGQPNSYGIDTQTFLFGFSGVGGVALGSTEELPLLPFVTSTGVFEFSDPTPGLWFDPPFAKGFEYELIGGGMFTEVRTPSAALGFGPIDIIIGGVVVDTLLPGESYYFSPGISKFSVDGLYLDTASPTFATAFPTYLDFTGSPSSLTMTSILSAVPEPENNALIMAGLLLVIYRKKRYNLS